MLKPYLFTLMLCIGILLVQCTRNPTEPENSPPRELTATEKLLVQSDNRFGFRLFRKIVESEENTNIFISPLSVSMALGMTYNGAAGGTREAMHETLEFGDVTDQELNESYRSLINLLAQLDPKVIFQLANSIWYREGFDIEEEFLQSCWDYFDADVTGLDFNDAAAADIINEWVSDKTNELIKEIIDSPIPRAMVMFLINAIYFKGTWTYEFDEELTQDDWFHLPDGTQTECRMMATEAYLPFFSTEEFRALDLPYGDGDFSMTIFLPFQGASIGSIIAQLNQGTWDSWMNGFSERTVTVQLPKFKLEYELKLNDILSALGMGAAFTELANFTRISTSAPLAISEVKHKTFIEVNEEGTEAAAVTSVGVQFTSDEPTTYLFRVDRSFLFVIRERHSGTILFIGKIGEPALE